MIELMYSCMTLRRTLSVVFVKMLNIFYLRNIYVTSREVLYMWPQILGSMRPLCFYALIWSLYRNFVTDFAIFQADFGIFFLFSSVWSQEYHLLDVHAFTQGLAATKRGWAVINNIRGWVEAPYLCWMVIKQTNRCKANTCRAPSFVV